MVFCLVRANSLSKYERERWETYKVYERSNWSCSSIALLPCTTTAGHACLVHVDHPHDCPTTEPYALGRSSKEVLALPTSLHQNIYHQLPFPCCRSGLEPKQAVKYLNCLSLEESCRPLELFTAQCSGRLNNGSSTSRRTIQYGRRQHRADEVTSNRPGHSRLEPQDVLSHTTGIGTSYSTA